jgi:protein CsiD
MNVVIPTQPRFEVNPHPYHERLVHIVVDPSVLDQFFQDLADDNVQHLEYVPYMRLVLAGRLQELLGPSFTQTLRELLHNRAHGGFTIGVQGLTERPDDFVKFGTAISHLVGIANFDAMSSTFYARFVVKDTDNSDSYLRQAYRDMTLHTDGTFVEEATDWLLMMKFSELNAKGGESRILHLDDWEDLDRFVHHPLATYPFTYKASSSKNVGQVIERRTFYKRNDAPCICFIDQFAYPETIDQAKYLQNLSGSMESSEATVALPLPVGDMIVLNNHFWLHGRAAFVKHPELHRELMRLRGVFAVE